MAGALLKVDGFDLSPHLRLAPGDGFDPVDGDGFLAPQWSEGGAGDGDALLSIHEGNREQSFAVILNPAKAAYSSTKDGLALLVRDLNRVLKVAKVIEWRDDGASNSTYFDVRFARFDAAWDYRRAQKLWLPGVIHATCKPYGSTGTARIVATAAASQTVAVVPIASGVLDGDTPADTVFTISVPSGPKGPLFAGAAIGAPAWVPVIPAASFNWGVATIQGASGAYASQMARLIAGSNDIGIGAALPASLPDAPFRILGLVRPNFATLAGSAIAMRAVQFSVGGIGALPSQPLTPLGPTQVFPRGHEWRVADLGVVSGGSSILSDSKLVIMGGLLSASVGAVGFLDVSAMVLLPEGNTVAMQQPSNLYFSGAQQATVTFNGVGRTALWQDGTFSAISDQRRVEANSRGDYPGAPVGSGCTAFAFALPDDAAQNTPMAVEIRCLEKFTYGR